MLVDGLSRRIPMTNAKGKQEMVYAYDAMIQHLFNSVSGMKPRELMAFFR